MDMLEEYGIESAKNNTNSDHEYDLNSFDTIILLDLSGSMYNRDFRLELTDTTVGTIKNKFDSDICEKFLSDIEGKEKICRYKGAVVCILLYILQNMERRDEDNISIIPFSNDAEAIKFREKKFFTPSNPNLDKMIDDLIVNIEEFLRGKTDIRSALEESIEVMKELEKDKMKNIILLTDDASDQKFNESDESVQNLVNKRLSPREDVVINTVGLDDDVDDEPFNSIASKTGGKFTKANSLKELADAFSHFSKIMSEENSNTF